MSTHKKTSVSLLAALFTILCFAVVLAGCSGPNTQTSTSAASSGAHEAGSQDASTASADAQQSGSGSSQPSTEEVQGQQQPVTQKNGNSAAEIRARLNITEDFRDSLMHGEKPAEFQKYIVMHDTEGDAEAANVVEWWDGNGRFVASHFVVNKDGSIVQCVPLDSIAHHAGFGDAGHNEKYGVEDESRDDKRGTESIGDWAPDYGMNSYSVGIEMVHVGSSGEDYPEEQLRAVDGLIAYIDAYYGFKSEIIDHNDWRTGNSDCSEEFQPYLRNLQSTRTHDGS